MKGQKIAYILPFKRTVDRMTDLRQNTNNTNTIKSCKKRLTGEYLCADDKQ